MGNFNYHGQYYDVLSKQICEACGQMKLTAPIEGREICPACADKGEMTVERMRLRLIIGEIVAVCMNDDEWARKHYQGGLAILRELEAK